MPVGRFAPTPSGDLHLGSLVSALGSFLQAKSQNGLWRLRIDDIDPPRVEKGAIKSILTTLEYYQLPWDKEIQCQSQNTEKYQASLNSLKPHIFSCACTRKQLKGVLIYPGTCRQLTLNHNHSIRCRTKDCLVASKDICLGNQQWNIAQDCGDFIIKRADQLFSYVFATVVDDIELGVTEIIRGSDLALETPKQLFLYQLFKQNPPRYGHLPLAKNKQGQKLSKQSFAKALPLKTDLARRSILSALKILGQNPQEELLSCSIEDILLWALKNWHIKKTTSSGLFL